MRNQPKFILVALFAIALPLKAAHAFSFALSPGLATLPSSLYQTLVGNAHFTFGQDATRSTTLHLGGSPLFRGHGYSQILLYTSFTWDWYFGPDWARVYGGIGPGIYFDKVSEQIGWVPAANFRFGTRIGAKGFGIFASVENYLGMWNPISIAYFVLWPFVIVEGGLYFGF